MQRITDKYLHFFSNNEKYFFYLILAIHLLPVLLYQSFPTVDGPAHLYNSRIIVDLFFHSNSPLSSFFVFNENFNPNWSGHFLLSCLLLVFPAFVAEKILILFYLIFFPMSFRFLFKQLELKEKYLIYFVFPFTYSFMFYYGFYNFHIALVFFFFTLGYWVQGIKNGVSIKLSILLILLTLLIFFSHLFVFIMLLGVVGMLIIGELISDFRIEKNSRKKLSQQLFIPLLVFLPSIILTVIYVINQPVVEGNTVFIPLKELWRMIQQAQPAKGIDYGKEDVFTKWIGILFVLISLALFIKRLINRNIPYIKKTILWGSISFSVLIGFFILPDSTGAMGFISSRLLLFFFLFFIIFLATQKSLQLAKILAFLIINYVNIALINIYIQSAKASNQLSSEIISVSEKIEAYATVFPIDDSNLFNCGHISNYLGANKPMVILENYEASLNYFPLKWNHEKMPYLHLGDFKLVDQKLFTHNYTSQTQIDYVFILTDTKSTEMGKNELAMKHVLERYYKLIYESNTRQMKLYKKQEFMLN